MLELAANADVRILQDMFRCADIDGSIYNEFWQTFDLLISVSEGGRKIGSSDIVSVRFYTIASIPE
jgi:hypothetical protein